METTIKDDRFSHLEEDMDQTSSTIHSQTLSTNTFTSTHNSESSI